MRLEILQLSLEISERQEAVAVERLASGLLHYFKHPEMDILSAQTVIGAMGIGLELTAKAYINRHGLLYTIQNPDDRTKIVFSTHDEELFSKHFAFVKEQILDNGTELIDFTKTFALLDTFGIHLNKDIKGKIELLRKARNESLHGFLSQYYLQTLPKIIYAVLKVIEAIDNKLQRTPFFSTELTLKFIKDFESNPTNTVFERIKAARLRVQQGGLLKKEIILAKEDELIVICPICGLESLSTGHFYAKNVEINYGYVEEHLFFHPQNLRCPHCGLELNDDDELYVAEAPKDVHISESLEIPSLEERKPPNYRWKSYSIYHPSYY